MCCLCCCLNAAIFAFPGILPDFSSTFFCSTNIFPFTLAWTFSLCFNGQAPVYQLSKIGIKFGKSMEYTIAFLVMCSLFFNHTNFHQKTELQKHACLITHLCQLKLRVLQYCQSGQTCLRSGNQEFRHPTFKATWETFFKFYFQWGFKEHGSFSAFPFYEIVALLITLASMDLALGLYLLLVANT